MNIIVSIPDGVKCLLKTGQKVEFSTPYLENKVVNDITIPVAIKLNIASDKIFSYLKKFVGDSIEKNEIIAEKKGLIGKSKIISNSTGVIKEINHYSGEIIVSSPTSQKDQVLAFFQGEVSGIDKKQVKLEVQDAHEFICKQISADFGGETFYLKNAAESMFAPQMSNKILVIESVTPYLLTKAEALGIEGFVSLKSPLQDSTIAKAQIRNIDDFKKVFPLNLPYCLINKQYSKIYFY